MGYDNLEERLLNTPNQKEQNELDRILTQTPTPNSTRDLAHETAFDKLLADFFLNKRNQFKKSRELIDQLDAKLVDLGFEDDHPDKTCDKKQIDVNSHPFQFNSTSSSRPMLKYKLLRQQLHK